jgi:hypothetical protein
MSTNVVHCKRSKYDVYIGRPSKWGNPFEIGKDGTREEVVEKYRAWVLTQPDLLAALHELKGKVLACWCSPQACHGDVLSELANNCCVEEFEDDFDHELDMHDYPVRICVAGSRTITDRERFDPILEAFLAWAGKEPFALISGDARHGPDRMVIEWAKEHNVPCFKFPADWDNLGKRAGMVRNGVMRKNITHLLAIWDGQSRGTKEMVESTMKIGDIHVSLVTLTPTPPLTD